MYQYFYPSWFGRKETWLLYSSISHLVLKQESRKSFPNCPESYTNDVRVNRTYMFKMLLRKTCPWLYGSTLNSSKAVSWPGAEFPHMAVTAGNLTSKYSRSYLVKAQILRCVPVFLPKLIWKKRNLTSLLFNFAFSVKTRIPEELS